MEPTDTDRTNNITLEYLINPQRYKKYSDAQEESNIEEIKRDRKFYKKRIIDLTKKMLKEEYPNNDLKMLFDKYLVGVIDHIKFLDKKDCMQEEYKDISNGEAPIYNLSNDREDINKIIMNTKPKIVNLDSFIISKNVEKEEDDPLPEKKKI